MQICSVRYLLVNGFAKNKGFKLQRFESFHLIILTVLIAQFRCSKLLRITPCYASFPIHCIPILPDDLQYPAETA